MSEETMLVLAESIATEIKLYFLANGQSWASLEEVIMVLHLAHIEIYHYPIPKE